MAATVGQLAEYARLAEVPPSVLLDRFLSSLEDGDGRDVERTA